MSEKAYILGVDDEELNRVILDEIFEDDYEFVCVENGNDCLQSIEQRMPDLVLLDVNMPDLSGLDVCKALREKEDTVNLPIIFVSALASDEERLAGYEAGGDDYVTKPFNDDELVAKVETVIRQAKERLKLKESTASATSAAMMAMTSASELGVAVQFMQDSFECNNYSELWENALEKISNYGVGLSLFIKQADGSVKFFSDGIERPLEMAVFDQLMSKGRVYSFGNKFILNGKRASLLIRNIPDGEEEKIGRLRDHLMVMLEAIDARLQAIENEVKIAKRHLALEHIIDVTQKEVTEIDQIYRQQQAGVSQELSDIMANLEAAFISLGLTDEQEGFLLGVIKNAENNTDELYKKGLELDQRFATILNNLRSEL